MKKLIACVICLALAALAAAAAEGQAEGFEAFDGMQWSFSSGVGAWSTDIEIKRDGSFSGQFHDSEMGETGEGYPEGTIYCCSFTGRMSFAGEWEGFARAVSVDELDVNEGAGTEYVDDGIRFVVTEPYGISKGDGMLLYRPGTPVSAVPEEMIVWAHLYDEEKPVSELDSWLLTSEANGSGFVGYQAAADVWLDMTKDELLEASGFEFGIPQGAENVAYRYQPGESMAEMRFTLGASELCARIRPAALEEGQLMNIADMYFAWDEERPVTVGRCSGKACRAAAGSEDRAELCLWYDAAPGLMYSLSMGTNDPEGPDIAAVALEVYIPVQGDA